MALPYTLTPEDRQKIGLIVLQSDETIEVEMRRMFPLDVDLLISRVPSGTAVTSDSLQQMAAVLTDAARLFPQGAEFSVIGYGCTSGTAQIGAGKIAALIRAGAMAQDVTEPVTALVASCNALGVSRIGLISPYVAEVSEGLRTVLSQNGITVTAFASFDEPQEKNVARIASSSITDAATELCREQEFDALFLSCTNLRTLDLIDPLEATTGLPILSSNQVLAWHMMKQAGDVSPGFAPGRLWKSGKQTAR